jgi:DNA-binding response OmpR family regulator
LIGSESTTSGALRKALQPLGLRLMTAPSIDAAAALDSRFDIVLVDVHPALHWEPHIFEQARVAWNAMIVALMHPSQALDRVLAFEFGADAVLERPFSDCEAIALLKALLRRHRAAGARLRVAASTPGRASPFTWQFDAAERRITLHGGAVIGLSTVESLIVSELIRRPGHVRSRADLLAASGLARRGHHLNVIDLAVSRLRKKLERAGQTRLCIQTVRGMGYMLRDADDAASR